jgi:alanine dehydrogenase
MGADVTVFGTSRVGLRRFEALAAGNVCCRIQERSTFEQAVLEADLVIGAVLISTYDTPALLDEALVRRMKPGAVIVDVTCGYGAGYMPTFDRLTTHDTPVYERFGVLHCKIDAMPASVPLTATAAMSSTIVPYVQALAEDIFNGKSDDVSRAGLVTADGAILHPEILRHIVLERALTGAPRQEAKEEATA